MSGEDYAVPDTSIGAISNCFCPWCQEARLNDNERMTFTAHDLIMAWRQGYMDVLMRIFGERAALL